MYKITLDGVTPFDQENNSEIVYDARGEPTEVIVWKVPKGAAPGGHAAAQAQEPSGSFSGHGGGHSGGGYGHSGGGSDHSGGGYESRESGYGGEEEHQSPGYMPTKKPGSFGKGTNNFKCEYASETLYVTKTDMTFDKKCFNVFNTQCKQEYAEGKGIGYKKECSEFSVTKCRTVFDTSSKQVCE